MEIALVAEERREPAIGIGIRCELTQQRGVVGPPPALALLDLVGSDHGRVHAHRQPGEVRDLELGPDVHLGGEGQLLAVVQLGDLEVRLAEREHVVLLEGLPVQLGNGLVDRLLQHHPAAEPLVDDARRPPARPEAGHAHLPADLAVGLVEAALQLLERNFDGQLHPGRAKLLDVGLHVAVTP